MELCFVFRVDSGMLVFLKFAGPRIGIPSTVLCAVQRQGSLPASLIATNSDPSVVDSMVFSLLQCDVIRVF